MKTGSLRKVLILCLLLSMLLSLALPASAEEAQLQTHHVSLLDLGAHMEIPDRDLSDATAHILQAVSNFEETISVLSYGMTLEEAAYCANNIYYSHPELFQLGGTEYSFTMYLLGDTVASIVPSYAYTKEEAPAAEAMILEEIDKICALVDPAWTDLEIALFLHDYLCVNFQYDNTYTNHNMYFFLRDRTGVCSSYYATYRYLLNRFHITSDYAISDPMNHIWTMLKLDGQWYHVDVTWDDPVYDSLGRAMHSCFLRSDSGISVDADGNASHHDWVLGPLVSQAQSISSAYEGWFWNTVDTAFVPQGESWYYIDDAKGICAVELTDAPAPTLAHSISDHWYVLNDPAMANFYWPGIFSGLSAHGKELIYNTPTAVKGYTPKTGATRTIYQLTDPTVNIYGSALQSGTLSIQLAGSPNEAGYVQSLPSIHTWLDATCTEPKTCNVCGSTEGNPLGHEWDQGTVTQAPTHTAPGKLTHTCQRDPSHTYEEEIPQLDTPEFSTVTLTLTGDASVETTSKTASYILSADHMDDLVSMTVTLNLDETYLTDPQVTGLNDWIVLAVQQENGTLTISLAHDPGAAGQAEVLRLTAAPTGKTGVTAVSVTEAALTATAADSQFSVEVDLTAASTTTEVIFNVYDMNQDGEISLLDVTRAQRFYGMDHPQADFNGDHTVDITDLVTILLQVLEAKDLI